jgi:hypothetical protein
MEAIMAARGSKRLDHRIPDNQTLAEEVAVWESRSRKATGRVAARYVMGTARPIPLHHRGKAAQMTFRLCFQLD